MQPTRGGLVINRPKEMRHLKNSIGFVFMVVCFCFTFVLIVSMLKVPDALPLYKNINMSKFSSNGNNSVGRYGNMMIEMLPKDLAFTVFVPSEKAFKRDLRLHRNDSFVGDDDDENIYAVISRVLGFSAVPRTIDSATVVAAGGKEVVYDSLSGFTLFISEDVAGGGRAVVVNGVRSTNRVDMRRGKIVVHVMDGVIMDAEFEQSVQPDDDDDDDDNGDV